ncbi:MAG: 2-amino-4-hydroxy-6-hydroxymethyldihydropteridine diphosphokinase [Anaerolineae bacterium]|nr:2-amino-4-hydroxy-6-hydroxymethyldihydropteridine diphosphokinase [Anaerolineae bacterium]
MGLGSNLGDREGQLRAAMRTLSARGAYVSQQSSLYETEPWGLIDQPRFLNACCQIITGFGPLHLLGLLKRIEQEMGRVPTVRYGPRTLDLDILFYADRQIMTSGLQIPHPGVLERATVLVPLADIAPHFRHPATGRTVLEHLHDLGPTPGVAPFPPGLPG